MNENKTEYEVINHLKNNTIVKIHIKTGKKHQIRVGFSKLGFPILGDKKYGKKDNETNLYLHANILDIIIKDKEYHFEAKIPEYFKKYIKN